MKKLLLTLILGLFANISSINAMNDEELGLFVSLNNNRQLREVNANQARQIEISEEHMIRTGFKDTAEREYYRLNIKEDKERWTCLYYNDLLEKHERMQAEAANEVLEYKKRRNCCIGICTAAFALGIGLVVGIGSGTG